MAALRDDQVTNEELLMHPLVDWILRRVYGVMPHDPLYDGFLFGRPVCRRCGRPHDEFWRRRG